jgi:phage portal protein BeeE
LGLAERISSALAVREPGEVATRKASRDAELRYSADTWLADFLIPAMNQFGYGGNTYGLNMSHRGVNIHEVANTLPGYMAALRACPPAFAAQLVRSFVVSQAKFTFRTRASSGKPKKTFGTRALEPLERPWRGATTGELVSRMEWHAGVAGNAYVTNRGSTRDRPRLRVLRPDWVAIVYGSQQDPEQALYALDGELLGYVYAIGGLTDTGATLAPIAGGNLYTLLPHEVAHWAPVPDPEAADIGMSWLTPAIRDMQVDRAATEHKQQFFAQGATPNLVIKGLQAATREAFLKIVEELEERHAGVTNAFRTLYLTAGADAAVVGSNFKDMDLKNIQGASETRISSLSRVPASLLGIAEGLAGSSLNAGNFGMARRIFADTWVYPSLHDMAAALAGLVEVPRDADLWPDVSDIPLLREDGKDAAEIEDIKATTITKYVREGFTPESSVLAVNAQDITLLVHTGKVSVQLQEPGALPPGEGGGTAPTPDGPAPTKPPGGARARRHHTRAKQDKASLAKAVTILRGLRKRLTGALRKQLDAVIGELTAGMRDAAFEAQHPRGPGGLFGVKRTGVLGAVLDKLAALEDKLGNDEDRAALRQAMHVLTGLESADIDDDDLNVPDDDEDVQEEDDNENENENDLTMDSSSGDIAFTPYADGDIDIDWDNGSHGVRLSPQSAKEIADKVSEFIGAPTHPGQPPLPDKFPDWVTDQKTMQQWVNQEHETWAASEAGQKHIGVVKGFTTTDGELKIERYGGGTTWIAPPDAIDADDWTEIIMLDDDEEQRRFAELLREAIARAGVPAQRSSNRAGGTRTAAPPPARYYPPGMLDTLSVEVARSRPTPGPSGKGRPGGAYNARFAELRHPAPPPHEQWMHTGGKGKTKAASVAKKAPAPAAAAQATAAPGPDLTSQRANTLQDRMFGEMPPPWTPVQRKALRQYSSNAFSLINSTLRSGRKLDPADDRALIKQIRDTNAAMKPTVEPMTVYRNTDFRALGIKTFNRSMVRDELRGLKGKTLQDPGFISTSIERDVTGDDMPVKLEIEVPAGTPAAYVERVSEFKNEKEWVLGPGQRMQLVAIKGDPTKDPFVVVRMKVMPA